MSRQDIYNCLTMEPTEIRCHQSAKVLEEMYQQGN